MMEVSIWICAKREQGKLRKMDNSMHRLFSTHAHRDIQYLVIPKCGCTFVKNVLWRIDYERSHDNPIRVHDNDDDFPRADDHGYTIDSIRVNPYAFTVFRNPIDRFLSLYFDKVIGDGHKNFVPLRELLVNYYGISPEPTSIKEHRRNCMILLDWIEMSFHNEAELNPNPHWTPQGWRMGVIKKYDLKILMLDNLGDKLKLLLRPLVPNIDQFVDGIEKNSSKKSIGRSQLMDDRLRERIKEIYHHDQWLTRRAWKYWSDNKPSHSDEIPRISQIIA